MTWLWIPHASSWSSTYECVGLLRTFHPLLTSRFTFQHLPAFVFCLFCVVVWFCCFGVFLFPVFALLCFWFLFCKCLGIPNSPRSLDLDDRQGLIARSAMQQKKNPVFASNMSKDWIGLLPTRQQGPTFVFHSHMLRDSLKPRRFQALAVCSLSFGPANQARIWLRLFGPP